MQLCPNNNITINICLLIAYYKLCTLTTPCHMSYTELSITVTHPPPNLIIQFSVYMYNYRELYSS